MSKTLLACPRHPKGDCSCVTDIQQGRRMLAMKNEQDEAAANEETFEWIPEAGYVIVVRNFTTEEHYRDKEGKLTDLVKPIVEQKHEEFKSRLAMVVKVGDSDPRTGEIGTWREQDRVLIEPSVFNEIELGYGQTVWLGPFCGIKARLQKVVAEDASEAAN